MVLVGVGLVVTAVPEVGIGPASAGSAGSYVVVLKPGVPVQAAAKRQSRAYGLDVRKLYTHALHGYAAAVPSGQLTRLKADPGVAYVERDQVVSQPGGVGRIAARGRDAASAFGPAGQVAAAPSTLGAALSDNAAGPGTVQSCLQANTADPNLLRLQLCLRGLSALSINGLQPGAGQPGVPAAQPSPGGSAGTQCGVPGNDRCAAWVARFDHADLNVFEFPNGMAVSPDGNQVFVAGVDWDLVNGGETIVVLAYDAHTGQLDWSTFPFSGANSCSLPAGGGCAATGIAVSPDGTRVFVTGYTQNNGTNADIRTLALDTGTGAVVWDNRLNVSGSSVDIGNGIAASPDGQHVYVTGSTFDPSNPTGTTRNVLTSYDTATGTSQWTTLGDLGVVYNKILAVGSNIYLTGMGENTTGTHLDAVTAANGALTGQQLWRTDYSGSISAAATDAGFDLALSPAGDRVYITGYTVTGINDFEWLTAAYDTRTGRQAWVQRHADQPGQNIAYGIAASPAGDRVYVTGYTTASDNYFKPTTVAYDTRNGRPAWTETYAPAPYSGGAGHAIAVSPDGSRIFVTGYYSNSANGFDSLTLGLDSANGGVHWVARYNSDSTAASACLSHDGSFYMAESPDGTQVYTAGYFDQSDYNPDQFAFGTFAYATGGGTANPQPGSPPAPPASECPQDLPWNIHAIGGDVSSTRSGDGTGTVTGSNVYVIGSGIDQNNPDLNVAGEVNFTNGPAADCNGLGTITAGTIGARDNSIGVVGVAPGIPMTGVKVVDCTGNGTLSDVLAGIDWVTAHAQRPAVVDFAFAFAANQALDDAVTASADSGIFYAVPAGNQHGDCSLQSPARIGNDPSILTTGSDEQTGRQSPFSNFGACVGIWAPGDFILSTALHGGDTFAYGTEFSAAHVAGAAALYLSTHQGTSMPAVKQALQANATPTGYPSRSGTPIMQVWVGNF